MPIPPRPITAQELVAFIEALPMRRRTAVRAFIRTMKNEDSISVAIFLKFLDPRRSDASIACICGLTRNTLATSDRYMWAKQVLSDFKPAKCQPSMWRKSNRGDRWALDHPGRE